MLQALPEETARKLSSAQVAVSPESVLKELVENSLDAGATSISIRIKDAGIGLISVRDDGCGVSAADIPLLLQRYTTSKIACFDDLAAVKTFGFRGEALNSIASLSAKTVVSTRTSADETGRVYEFDRNRRIVDQSTKALQIGTQIDVEKLFNFMPVRKQAYSKQAQQTCKRIRDMVIGFALILPNVRFTLKFEKSSSGKLGSSGEEAAMGLSKSSVPNSMVSLQTRITPFAFRVKPAIAHNS
eukprot:jgi/Hompol1/5494/HPOL_000196-RA